MTDSQKLNVLILFRYCVSHARHTLQGKFVLEAIIAKSRWKRRYFSRSFGTDFSCWGVGFCKMNVTFSKTKWKLFHSGVRVKFNLIVDKSKNNLQLFLSGLALCSENKAPVSAEPGWYFSIFPDAYRNGISSDRQKWFCWVEFSRFPPSPISDSFRNHTKINVLFLWNLRQLQFLL